MIESVTFRNYKALRNTTLLLRPFTVVLGPNGSGKSSVLQALKHLAPMASSPSNNGHLTSGWKAAPNVAAPEGEPIEIRIRLRWESRLFDVTFHWNGKGGVTRRVTPDDGTAAGPGGIEILEWLRRMQIYALEFSAISESAIVGKQATLDQSGKGLAAVLDDLRDNQPERWEALLAEMREWLPEYDFIHFETSDSRKAIALRTKRGGHRIPAKELSQGTLVALALLTLAYIPNPPSLIGLEEIDRGLHPRLLRHLQDALYRLSYPEACGEKRPPIQVIATTHSPYLLDLYREHPEEVVLAEKQGLEVQFRRLSEIEHYKEILGDSPLSEVWYSGVLGGVSVKP